MNLPDGRYERLRRLVMNELGQAQADMDRAAQNEDTLAFESAQDDADEWALLVAELDAAVPAPLRELVAGAN